MMGLPAEHAVHTVNLQWETFVQHAQLKAKGFLDQVDQRLHAQRVQLEQRNASMYQQSRDRQAQIDAAEDATRAQATAL